MATNRNTRLLNSATQYVLDVKPYHTKLRSLVTELFFEDRMTVVMDERLFTAIHLQGVWTKDDLGGWRLQANSDGSEGSRRYRIPYTIFSRFSVTDSLDQDQSPLGNDPSVNDLTDANPDGTSPYLAPWNVDPSIPDVHVLWGPPYANQGGWSHQVAGPATPDSHDPVEGDEKPVELRIITTLPVLTSVTATGPLSFNYTYNLKVYLEYPLALFGMNNGSLTVDVDGTDYTASFSTGSDSLGDFIVISPLGGFASSWNVSSAQEPYYSVLQRLPLSPAPRYLEYSLPQRIVRLGFLTNPPNTVPPPGSGMDDQGEEEFINNSGNGTIGSITVDQTTGLEETWFIEALSATMFNVVGSLSGPQAAATVGVAYSNGIIGFTITAGLDAFSAGDRFFIVTTRVASYGDGTNPNSPVIPSPDLGEFENVNRIYEILAEEAASRRRHAINLLLRETGRYHVPFHHGSRVYVDGVQQEFGVDYVVDGRRGWIQFLAGFHPADGAQLLINYFKSDRFFISVNTPFEPDRSTTYDDHRFDIPFYDSLFSFSEHLSDKFTLTVDFTAPNNASVVFYNVSPGTIKGEMRPYGALTGTAAQGDVWTITATSASTFAVQKVFPVPGPVVPAYYGIPFDNGEIFFTITNTWVDYYMAVNDTDEPNTYAVYDLDIFDLFPFSNVVDDSDFLVNLDLRTEHGVVTDPLPTRHAPVQFVPWGRIRKVTEATTVGDRDYYEFVFDEIPEVGAKIQFQIEQATQYNELLGIGMDEQVRFYDHLYFDETMCTNAVYKVGDWLVNGDYDEELFDFPNFDVDSGFVCMPHFEACSYNNDGYDIPLYDIGGFDDVTCPGCSNMIPVGYDVMPFDDAGVDCYSTVEGYDQDFIFPVMRDDVYFEVTQISDDGGVQVGTYLIHHLVMEENPADYWLERGMDTDLDGTGDVFPGIISFELPFNPITMQPIGLDIVTVSLFDTSGLVAPTLITNYNSSNAELHDTMDVMDSTNFPWIPATGDVVILEESRCIVRLDPTNIRQVAVWFIYP